MERTVVIELTTDAPVGDILRFTDGLVRDAAALNNWSNSEGDTIPVALVSYEITGPGLPKIKATFGGAQ